MTVEELRKVLADLPDHALVHLSVAARDDWDWVDTPADDAEYSAGVLTINAG